MIPSSFEVNLLILDCDGNTIDEDYVEFDRVLANKHQKNWINRLPQQLVFFVTASFLYGLPNSKFNSESYSFC